MGRTELCPGVQTLSCLTITGGEEDEEDEEEDNI
jgi:hypothetical protein